MIELLLHSSVTTKLSLSEEEWISVLTLSTKWSFVNLREIAISELESLRSLTPLNKVILGRRCFIPPWVLSGLTEIAGRTEPISNEDAVIMGPTTTATLCRQREFRLQNQYNNLRNRHHNRNFGGWNVVYDDDLLEVSYDNSRKDAPSTVAISSAFAAELRSLTIGEQKLKSNAGM
jgi:hypothetical protein